MQPQSHPQLRTFQLQEPAAQFTDGDMEELTRIFRMPIVSKYLMHLLWSKLVEQGNIPISDLIAEQQQHILRVAFIKGGIGILQTLLSISTED